jgi:5-methylcytosine-specific restriction endonuclease McrA
MNKKSFYNNKQWRKLASYIRHKHFYTCSVCGNRGTYVHHIIPLTNKNINDMSITLNEDNLQLLCHDCHNDLHMGNAFIRDDVKFNKDGQLIKSPPASNKHGTGK